MGNIKTKQKNISSQKQKNKINPSKIDDGKKFVLSDVSKEELNKRRIPVYPYPVSYTHLNTNMRSSEQAACSFCCC